MYMYIYISFFPLPFAYTQQNEMHIIHKKWFHLKMRRYKHTSTLSFAVLSLPLPPSHLTNIDNSILLTEVA